MTPLRLLAIIEANSISGPAKNLLAFSRMGRPAGIETTFATFQRGGGTNLFIETAKAQGTPIEVIAEAGLYETRVLTALNAVADRLQPGIIQTHAVKSHFLVRYSGVADRFPWVAFHHGYTWPTIRARLYNQLDRWSLRTARKVLTVSIPFREQLAARGVNRERIEIVHNAISPDWGAKAKDIENAAGLRKQLGIDQDSHVVLAVGRLSREKDHATLLEALSDVRRGYKAHLLIVGEGPERPAIEGAIRRLGLEGAVTLTGQQPSAEPFYAIASAAVLSSLSEGSPNALLEAMAAGVPVAATQVGGIPEIVSHEESALLVPSRDPAALSRAISRLLSPDQALAQALVDRGRELIQERHSPEARVRRLAGIYVDILESR
jgi:glycosyltransferase involved in cell wall biosynthesis